MKYDPITKILTMTQTDLEHCGFDWGEFLNEMCMHDIDDAMIDGAMGCHTIVVSMHKGLHPNGAPMEA
jgi:hypothetical protein